MQLSRNRRRSIYHRKRKKNPIPLLIFLAIVGFILWAIFQVAAMLFQNIRTESASAEVQILKGQSHFLLPDSEDWSLAFSEQKLWPGESIKTNDSGRTSLDIFEGNTLFLGPRSEVEVIELEEKSNESKILNLALKKGTLWVKTAENDFDKKGSRFEIKTDQLTLNTKSATFDITQKDNQDVVRLIKGSLDLLINNGEADPIPLTLGVGQKVSINQDTLSTLAAGGEILEIIDTTFIESEWHLKNLEVFFPQEAQIIRQRIEKNTVSTDTEKTPETPSGSAEIESPTVIAPQDGITIPATENRIEIEGTAPLNAFQIEVNGFALTQFSPGDKKWRYFAGSEWGTLLNGENKFSVVTITQDGKRSIPTVLTIKYEGTGAKPKTTPAPTTSDTTTETKSTDASFTVPEITHPTSLDAKGVHQTASPAITIKGNVDPKTQSVEVNGYQLQRFSPGDTTFRYTAVDNGPAGNMKVGENTYRIVAFGPNGKQSETSVIIHYTPIEL